MTTFDLVMMLLLMTSFDLVMTLLVMPSSCFQVYDAKVKQLQLKLSEEERENNSMKETMMNEERTVHALRQDVAAYESNSESLRKRIKEVPMMMIMIMMMVMIVILS